MRILSWKRLGWTPFRIGLLCLSISCAVLFNGQAQAEEALAASSAGSSGMGQDQAVYGQEEREAAWQRLKEIYDLILDEYDGSISPDELTRRAIDAMVKQLDRYSEYLDPEEMQEFNQEVENNFTGIGIVIGKEGEGLLVKQVLSNSPAEQAGLKPGDLILEADGTPLKDLDLEEAGKLIRGPAGSKVDLLFRRPMHDYLLRLIVERQNIEIPNVESRMLEDGIGLITINSFSRTSGTEFKEAYQNFLEQGMRGLILDLRGNGGGHLASAIEVARQLVPDGPVVYIKRADGQVTPIHTIPHEQHIPVAVLVNRGTASASEIVAGAIRDSGVGILVGTTTFGKGTVQTLYQLDDGSVIKLTTARYLTPKQFDLDGQGLAPDFTVELLGLPVNDQSDAQLQKALDWLRQHDGLSG